MGNVLDLREYSGSMLGYEIVQSRLVFFKGVLHSNGSGGGDFFQTPSEVVQTRKTCIPNLFFPRGKLAQRFRVYNISFPTKHVHSLVSEARLHSVTAAQP